MFPTLEKSHGLARKLRRISWSLRKRLAPVKPVILPFDEGLKISIRPIDRLGRRVFLDGYSEPDLARFLHLFLKTGDIYFDVGAHFGQYVLVAARLVGSTGRVHAFEPTQYTYNQLQENVVINKLDWVQLNHNAVYDKTTTISLTVCLDGKGEFNSLGKPLRADNEIIGTEKVTAITLDNYCREENVDQINLMKIDVEGAELSVLNGGQNLLAQEQAPTVVCEFNERTTENMGYSTQQLRQAFEKLGYRLYSYDAGNNLLQLEAANTTYNKTVNLIATKSIEQLKQRLSIAS